MGARRPLVPVLVGPTAVGKTAVAIELARFLPVTVISADSRQIYRGLDIGTAKPTAEERSTVPHLGLDLVEPGERYSAGRYAAEAARWIEALPGDRQPVVVGGTGFYIRALADGLFREPPMDVEKRRLLRDWTGSLDGPGRWAVRLDPGFAGGGRQRAVRAIEVALLTGRSLSWWQRQAKVDAPIDPWYVRLTVPRPVLSRRIESRVREMLGAGFVEEVRAVLDRGVPWNARGLDAVGYREVVSHLRGLLPAESLVDSIAAGTRQYAKRQETWFRHQLGGESVLVLNATDTPSTLAARIADLWERRCASE